MKAQGLETYQLETNGIPGYKVADKLACSDVLYCPWNLPPDAR